MVTARRYCDELRTCSRTGITERCGAPLRPYSGGVWMRDGDLECRVCEIVRTWHTNQPRSPVGEYQRYRNMTETQRAKCNEWEFGEPIRVGRSKYVEETINFGAWNAVERGRYEAARRPRVRVDDAVPVWRCSSREVLEEMYPRRHARDLPATTYDQLGVIFAHWLDNNRDHIGDTSVEWRNAITRLHRDDNAWIADVSRLLVRQGGYALARHPVRRSWHAISTMRPWPVNATIVSFEVGSSARPLLSSARPLLSSTTVLGAYDAVVHHQNTVVDDD